MPNMSGEMANVSSVNLIARGNNFDFLRFIFAVTVFLVHAKVLSGSESLDLILVFLSSEIAVKSFFIISGFLIFMSHERSQSNMGYFIRRVSRIYPAYVVVVLACVLIGGVFSDYPAKDYFFSEKVIIYLCANLVFLNFLQPDLPGLFLENRLTAVNGALWTLKVEVMFYICVPFISMAFRNFNRVFVLGIIYVSSLVYFSYMGEMASRTGLGVYLELQRQVPGQFAFFVVGAMCYFYFGYFYKYKNIFLAVAILLVAFQYYLPWPYIQPIALGIIVIYAAYCVPYFANFSKYGDFSYGIYIVHFPILQILIAQRLFDHFAWGALVLSGALTLGISFLLWHGIEKRFLSRSAHYTEITS